MQRVLKNKPWLYMYFFFFICCFDWSFSLTLYIVSSYLLHFLPLPSLNSSPPPFLIRWLFIYFLPISCLFFLFLPLSLSLHLPLSSIFVSYLYRLIFILFRQLNVVRGSGRFIPTPPYPTYLYGRVLKRDQVRWTVAFCVFTFQCSCLVVVFFVFCCCCCCFGLFSFVFVVLTH